MSRPLRLDHPGAVWHVTSRGNERRPIFRDDRDRETWLGLLAGAGALCAWRIHGYVLMGNHYHLMVETPEATLSRGMRQLNGVYTQAFNRRHRRVGHLFQGRFNGVLVERESQLLELARYVVLNPVRAGLVGAAREWRWSNYPATAGEAAAPAWLETDWTLAHFGHRRDEARRGYREFVAAGRGVPLDPWKGLRGQIYLGSEAFVREARRRAAAVTSDPEIPRPQRQPGLAALPDVLPGVLAALATTREDLTAHPRKRARERALVAYALRRFAGATGGELAPLLGVTAWRASGLAREGERRWKEEGLLATSLEAVARSQTADARPDPLRGGLRAGA